MEEGAKARMDSYRRNQLAGMLREVENQVAVAKLQLYNGGYNEQDAAAALRFINRVTKNMDNVVELGDRG